MMGGISFGDVTRSDDLELAGAIMQAFYDGDLKGLKASFLAYLESFGGDRALMVRGNYDLNGFAGHCAQYFPDNPDAFEKVISFVLIDPIEAVRDVVNQLDEDVSDHGTTVPDNAPFPG